MMNDTIAKGSGKYLALNWLIHDKTGTWSWLVIILPNFFGQLKQITFVIHFKPYHIFLVSLVFACIIISLKQIFC